MMPLNLASKLAMFDDYWQPRVVGSFNGHDLMVVKVKGEFVWHAGLTWSSPGRARVNGS